MRLLKIEAGEDVSLTEFFQEKIPEYAILSHTWGSDKEEVTFKDIVDGTGCGKIGYAKIVFCGQRALVDNLQYFWVDTCCIDKSSSSELTEAILSMFDWYQKATKCYVYLSDVQDGPSWKTAFAQSRWHSRGWTLQELIAPRSVEFFSKEGTWLGDKISLEEEIATRSGIDVLALRGEPLSNFSIADRMSWAAKRTTTRDEDNAYCLLGIFDVYMPLLYGEGRRAKARLIREINIATQDIPDLSSIQTVELAASEAKDKPALDCAGVARWLKSHDPSTNHSAAQRKRQTHTGSWFLDGKQYRAWLRGVVPLMWISGIPGSGKTILCSTIIEDVIEISSNDASILTAYYYFDFSEADNGTIDSFIRSLIAQLTIHLSELPHDLSDLHKSCRDSKQEPSVERLKEVLKTIMMMPNEIMIVVDALDECSTPEELVHLIEEIGSWNHGNMQLLVVSRRHFQATDTLEDLRLLHVSIQDEAANNDIHRFVREMLSKDRRLRKLPFDVKTDIEKILISRSNGMFRWVACQTDVLKKCRTQNDIEQVLRTLPPTLEESYSRVLDTIDDTWQLDVRAILQWLAFSARPMRLEEVAEIVTFDTEHAAIDLTRRLLNPLDILTMCSSLLITNKAYCDAWDAAGWAVNTKGTIAATELRLAHLTVKDYLLSASLENSEHAYYKLEETSSHLQITRACLTYLNMDAFSQGYQGRSSHATLLEEWPLLQFAAKACGHHLKYIESDMNNADRALLQKLFSSHTRPNGGNFGTLVGTAWPTAPRDMIQTTKPLYFAASNGLATMVRLLLTGITTAELEAVGGRFGSTSLQVATYRGHTECVRLLLVAGADPNSTNLNDETSLRWARILGFGEIIDLLRKYGAIK